MREASPRASPRSRIWAGRVLCRSCLSWASWSVPSCFSSSTSPPRVVYFGLLITGGIVKWNRDDRKAPVIASNKEIAFACRAIGKVQVIGLQPRLAARAQNVDGLSVSKLLGVLPVARLLMLDVLPALDRVRS